MSTVKKRLSILLTMILIVSFPLSSIVFAEGPNSSSESIQICQTYTKNINSLKRDEVQIVINSNGTATAFFETTMNCVEVTFSDYTYVGSPQPYENQVLFSSETMQVDTPGKHSITIGLPPCGPSQLDVYLGPVQTQLKPGTGHDYLIKYAFQDATGCTTPTPTPTITPSPTPSESPDPTPSSSPDPTPSESPDPTPSSSPDPTPSESPDPTPSSSPDPTPSESPDPTPSNSPDPTPSESPDPTPSNSPDPTPSESPDPTPSNSPDPTPSESPDPTPSSSPDPTPSSSPSTSPPASPSTPPSESPSAPPTATSTTPPTVPPTESPPESAEPTETTIIIEEEPIPRGGPNEEIDSSTNENLPPVDTLPKTGETSPIPYYLLGSFVIVSGLMVLRSRKRQKE